MNADPQCLFCKIAAGQIPAKVVKRNDEALVFEDINPQAPTHLLGIPLAHISTMDDVTAGDWPKMNAVLKLLQETARDKGLAKEGYRLVNNMGPQGGQTVYHLHFHLLGGRDMTWPPG